MKRLGVIAAMPLVGAAPAERVVRMDDPVVAVRIDGQPVRLRVDPSAPNMPMVARIGGADAPRRKMGISFGFAVGPVTVIADTAVARVDYGGGPRKQRIGRVPRPFATDAPEGSVGPGGLPDPVVRFVLRPTVTGERTVTLPMLRAGFPETMFGAGWMPSAALVTLDGGPLRVRFDPFHRHTLATAGAAARIARLQQGTLSGETIPTDILYGVIRPVRLMTLAQPLAIGPLAMSRIGVRTADYGRADTIRDADVAQAKADSDEIVVTAAGNKRDLRRDTLSIGADALARCSSIVFDRPAGVIRLSCA